MSGLKRRAEVPRAAQGLGGQVSKADLLEVAWHLASLCHDGGCDDAVATYQRLLDELNNGRERQGRPPVRLTEWDRKAFEQLRRDERAQELDREIGQMEREREAS